MKHVVLFTSVIVVLMPARAFAHALGVECKLKDGKVLVEAFYDDDTPAAKAKVEVVNAKDEVISKDMTDGEGRWSFTAPAPGKYEVRVDAGAGHRATTSITIPGAAAPEPVTSISENTRAEFTGVPWLKMTIGFVTIGTLCGAFLIASALRKVGKAVDGSTP